MKNKVAMVTGASVGIGRAVAIKMAKENVKLILVDCNKQTLENLGKELDELNAEYILCPLDIANEEQVNDAAAKGFEKFGKIDILINNAAVWRVWEPFMTTSVEKWNTFMDINVMGVVYATRAVLPKMIENGYGRIVNVGSVAGVYGNANMVVYSATKGALIAMSKALAKEVTSQGVVVNCVSPGTVSPSENPDMDFYRDNDQNYTGRTGTDNENADLICFLASEKNGYIVGQNIQIDGGRKRI